MPGISCGAIRAGFRAGLRVLIFAVAAIGSAHAEPYQPDASGQVVMEAERFDANVSQGDRDWVADFTPGYVGDSAMQSVPDSFFKVDSNIGGNSPRLDYLVEYAATTTVYVWIRGVGLSGSRDSVWIGVDGDDTQAVLSGLTRGAYGWTLAEAQLTVPAGVHTINVWMREDGSIVDRILLTPDTTVPSGDGPPESSRGSGGGDPSNTPPEANDDSFTVDEDTTGNVLAVLADNGSGADSDADADPLTITTVTPASAGGTVAVNASADALLYTPAADFTGTESFGYTISDGRGGTASATVTVTVANTNNDPPVLDPVGSRSVTEEQTLSFTVSASDIDGDTPLMGADLAGLPGTPSFTDNNNGTGSFSWTPAAGDAPGPYSVTFTATDALDGALSSSETISIDVEAAGGGGGGGGSGSGAYQPDASGQVVMEAERFDANVSQGERDWVADFTAGYVGDSAMQSVPNTFYKVDSNIGGNSPRLDYLVEYSQPTTVTVWVRGLGLSGSRDSVWVGVDGDAAQAEVIGLTRGAWGWESAAAQLTVPAGVHTINVWMREDGSIIDRILLTPDATVPSGEGPPESSRGSGGGGGSPLPLVDDFSDGSAADWTIFDDGTQFPSDWSVLNLAFRQGAWTNSSGRDVIESYHRGSYAYWTESGGLTDYRLSVDVTPGAEAGDDIGVMFRYVNDNNYYRFSLNSINGFARLEQKLNGTYITLASDHRGYVPGQPINIVVEADGPLLQVFVDDDPLFAVSNGDHASGGIALYSRDVSVFDNVVLSENDTGPEIVIAEPTAHNVLPGAPLDLAVSAVARNVPATGSSVRFQYHAGGTPTLCATASEGPSGVYSAQCLGMPAGDYTVEAVLLDNGVEVDRDSNASVAVGAAAFGSHRYDAIGDSITRGVADNFKADNLNLLDQRTLGITGWPAVLGDLLTSSTGAPSLVGNEGISGDRAGQTRDERLASIIERNPESDRALVMLGTNDSNDFNTTPTADLVAAVQAIIDELQANGRDTVYLPMLPPTFGRNTNEANIYDDPLAPTSTRTQKIIEYNTALQGLLSQPGVEPGPDLFSCFLTATSNRFSLFEDPLHPNALGHAMIAALWRDALLSGPVSIPMDPCPAPIYILESLDPYAHGHKQNLLEEGDRYYVDEAFTLTNVPPELGDGVWVMPANADNANADANFLSFDAGSAPVTVYIAYDPAGDPPVSSTHAFSPATLSESLTVSDPAVGTFAIARAESVTGTVTIGGTKSAASPGDQQAYLVIVVP